MIILTVNNEVRSFASRGIYTLLDSELEVLRTFCNLYEADKTHLFIQFGDEGYTDGYIYTKNIGDIDYMDGFELLDLYKITLGNADKATCLGEILKLLSWFNLGYTERAIANYNLESPNSSDKVKIVQGGWVKGWVVNSDHMGILGDMLTAYSGILRGVYTFKGISNLSPTGMTIGRAALTVNNELNDRLQNYIVSVLVTIDGLIRGNNYNLNEYDDISDCLYGVHYSDGFVIPFRSLAVSPLYRKSKKPFKLTYEDSGYKVSDEVLKLDDVTSFAKAYGYRHTNRVLYDKYVKDSTNLGLARELSGAVKYTKGSVEDCQFSKKLSMVGNIKLANTKTIFTSKDGYIVYDFVTNRLPVYNDDLNLNTLEFYTTEETNNGLRRRTEEQIQKYGTANSLKRNNVSHKLVQDMDDGGVYMVPLCLYSVEKTQDGYYVDFLVHLGNENNENVYIILPLLFLSYFYKIDYASCTIPTLSGEVTISGNICSRLSTKIDRSKLSKLYKNKEAFNSIYKRVLKAIL